MSLGAVQVARFLSAASSPARLLSTSFSCVSAAFALASASPEVSFAALDVIKACDADSLRIPNNYSFAGSDLCFYSFDLGING
jgi:hypothetical protein